MMTNEKQRKKQMQLKTVKNKGVRVMPSTHYEKLKKRTKNQKNFPIGKILMTLMLFSPNLSFAAGKETEIFHTAKERFLAFTGDTALVFCVVGALLAIAIWAAWKGNIKIMIISLVCSGLVAKFSSVVEWVIKFFGKAG
jgi:hypothetical protein